MYMGLQFARQAFPARMRYGLLTVSFAMCALANVETSGGSQLAATTQQDAITRFKACHGSDWKHTLSPETDFWKPPPGDTL